MGKKDGAVNQSFANPLDSAPDDEDGAPSPGRAVASSAGASFDVDKSSTPHRKSMTGKMTGKMTGHVTGAVSGVG